MTMAQSGLALGQMARRALCSYTSFRARYVWNMAMSRHLVSLAVVAVVLACSDSDVGGL